MILLYDMAFSHTTEFRNLGYFTLKTKGALREGTRTDKQLGLVMAGWKKKLFLSGRNSWAICQPIIISRMKTKFRARAAIIEGMIQLLFRSGRLQEGSYEGISSIFARLPVSLY